AHLILLPWLLGWTFDPNVSFVFSVLLQWGTLLAVTLYFWRDLWRVARAVVAGLIQRKPFEAEEARLGWLLVLATIPASVVGLLLKDFVETLHHSPVIVSAILLGTAALLFLSEYLGHRTRTISTLTWLDALLIGCAQSIALLPGVSRSAATISGGLLMGLKRPSAARFSFLMSIPVLFAAGVLALRDLFAVPNFSAHLPPLLLGSVASAVVGYLCIRWLLNFLARQPMHVFGWYRIVVGVIFLAVALLRG
ncbi:MAG: undecaprenyl-diphosphate phosphatase, partial [Anaerolineales bacterium]